MKVRKMSKQHNNGCATLATAANSSSKQQQQQPQNGYMCVNHHYPTTATTDIYYHTNLKSQKHAQITIDYYQPNGSTSAAAATTSAAPNYNNNSSNYIYGRSSSSRPSTTTNAQANSKLSIYETSGHYSTGNHMAAAVVTNQAVLANQSIKNRIYVNDEMLKYQMNQLNTFEYGQHHHYHHHNNNNNNNNHYGVGIGGGARMYEYRGVEKSGFEQLDDLINSVKCTTTTAAAVGSTKITEITGGGGVSGMTNGARLIKEETILPVLMPLPIPSMAIPRLFGPHQPTYQNTANGFSSLGVGKTTTSTPSTNNNIITQAVTTTTAAVSTSNSVSVRPPPTPEKSTSATNNNTSNQYETNLNGNRPNRSSSNNSAGAGIRNSNSINCNMNNASSSHNNDANDDLIYKLNKHIYNKQIARSEDNLKVESINNNKRDRSQPTATRVIKIEQGSPPPPPRLKIHVDSSGCNLRPKASSMPKEAGSHGSKSSRHHLSSEMIEKPTTTTPPPPQTNNTVILPPSQQLLNIVLDNTTNNNKRDSKSNTCNSVTGHTISNDAQFSSSPFKFPSPIEKLKSNSMTSVGIEPDIPFKCEPSIKNAHHVDGKFVIK